MTVFQRFMSWLGFTVLEPPAGDYLQALARVPYEAGRVDCSNKARAYQLALIELGYDARYVSVRCPRNNHAVVWFKLADGTEMFADPTIGKYGGWLTLPWPSNGVRTVFDNPAEFGVSGIDYGAWKAGKMLA